MRLLRRPILILAALGLLVAGCGSDDTGGERRAVTDDDFAPQLILSEFKIQGDLIVPEGGIVAQVRNTGFVEHNVGLEGGPFSETLDNEGETQLDLGVLTPGEYVLYCDIEGHRESGMEAILTVLPVADDGTMSVPAASDG